ncbi:MAG: hypothetical protein C4530_24120 [Desulfobacteraceae bacterium]|nr:MAG: hypothetical protein C4530_24120 [Desulfobacteraceae bacterium]
MLDQSFLSVIFACGAIEIERKNIMENTSSMDTKRIVAIAGYVALIIFLLILDLKFAHATSTPLNKSSRAGILETGFQEGENLITIVLVGATDYEVAEIFNEIIENTPGVAAAKRYRFSLFPAEPAKCRVEWQVVLEKTSLFDLESRIYRNLQKVSKNDEDAKTVKLMVNPTPEQLRLLARIHPLQAASKEIGFQMLHSQKNRGNRNLQNDTCITRWPDRGFE